jgi:nucleotide-binding universal stress UspA family protein
VLSEAPVTVPFVHSILHPTDFSHSSLVAFDHALALAVRCRGELTVLHAGVEEADHPFEHFPAVRATLQRWGYLDAGSRSSAVFDRLGVRIRKVNLENRSPLEAAHRYLDKGDTDLVALATEGRDGMPAWLRPSTAERIARHTRSMSLFVQQGVRGFVDHATGRLSLSRILVPVAHDPDAQTAVIAAVRLAGLISTPVEIVLFHVGEDPMPAVTTPHDPRLTFRAEHGHGDIVDEVDRAVRELQADLAVMATDGRDGFLGAIGRGSHTERAVRQCACPVLAVPVV